MGLQSKTRVVPTQRYISLLVVTALTSNSPQCYPYQLSSILDKPIRTLHSRKMPTIIPLPIKDQVPRPLHRPLRTRLCIPIKTRISERALDPILREHGKLRKVLMPYILIVRQARRHDTIAEIVQRHRRQDMLLPLCQLLALRIRCLVVFLAQPDHYPDRVVLQHPPDRVRTRAHHDRVAHMVLQPIVDSGLDFGLPLRQLDAFGQGRGGKVEMHGCAGVGVLGTELAPDPVAPVASLDCKLAVPQAAHQGVEDARCVL